jgi:hypothetical protein
VRAEPGGETVEIVDSVDVVDQVGRLDEPRRAERGVALCAAGAVERAEEVLVGEPEGVRRPVGRRREREPFLRDRSREREQVTRRRARQVGVGDPAETAASSAARTAAP